MYKTLVYTLFKENIKRLAHRKQQKLQNVILFSSTLTHSPCDAGNIAFCNFLLFSMCKSLNVAVNKCIS